ncbi:hypothetical protein BS47DRAFT_1398902 [Hydnum rufescens UP504]|uniref:2Fe-2S ferredoxin-type domain-containing protein n=1 Tax=Hydnum rufescens UP504 TaxID=1448309 RepID=A0A9P6AJT0_9AGAM|nr:hypothetical protein BS47DRAFT_1398902 [Hydnum rufescens UP504]
MLDFILKMKPHRGSVNISYDPSLPPSSDPLEPSQGETLVQQINISSLKDPSFSSSLSLSAGKARHIYVCTHGTRDCRCGTVGTAVYDRFQACLDLHSLDVDAPEVQLRMIGHVGGHKYAGNVLDLPNGDWYGSVTADDAPAFLRALLSSSEALGVGSRSVQDDILLWSKWRGRMGMTNDEQLAYYEGQAISSAGTPFAKDISGSQKAALLSITFETHEGNKVILSAEKGRTLMSVAKEKELPGITGTCGGNLECATCHVYIEPSASGYMPQLSPPSEEEEDMLDYALLRSDSSRLGCQIQVTEELAHWCSGGGVIKLPKY